MTETGGPEQETASQVKRDSALLRFKRFFGFAEKTPEQIQTRAAKDAQEITQELNKYPPDRRFTLVVGWSSNNTVGHDLSYLNEPKKFGLIRWTTFNGMEAVILYQEVRKMNPDESIVVVVDDQLASVSQTVKTGQEVVERIVQTSKKNGWELPLIISKAVSKASDFRLDDTFADSYLGNIGSGDEYFEKTRNTVLEAIKQGIPFSAVAEQKRRMRFEVMEAERARQAKQKEEARKAYEESIKPEMRRQAEKALSELDQKQGKKALIIIIDDTPQKIEEATAVLNKHAEETEIEYVVRGISRGTNGIIFYEECTKLAAPDTRIVILMDGFLGEEDDGPQVTKRLVETVRKNSLKLPYIVGESGDRHMNQDIQEACPENYLGSFKWDEQEATLKAIETTLK